MAKTETCVQCRREFEAKTGKFSSLLGLERFCSISCKLQVLLHMGGERYRNVSQEIDKKGNVTTIYSRSGNGCSMRWNLYIFERMSTEEMMELDEKLKRENFGDAAIKELERQAANR